MSTHNIGFYEEMGKIIFQLSSVWILKLFSPLVFCCVHGYRHFGPRREETCLRDFRSGWSQFRLYSHRDVKFLM